MCTSLPGGAVPEVGVPHVDKLVHFLLYFVLGVLVGRALKSARADVPASDTVRRMLALAVVGIALFAAADEWHQRWVPGRSTELLDWCADMTGGTLALLLAARSLARPEPLT